MYSYSQEKRHVASWAPFLVELSQLIPKGLQSCITLVSRFRHINIDGAQIFRPYQGQRTMLRYFAIEISLLTVF